MKKLVSLISAVALTVAVSTSAVAKPSPDWVPAYTQHKGAWWVSMIFFPPLLILNVMAGAVDVAQPKSKRGNLRKTTGAIVKHGLTGRSNYVPRRAKPKSGERCRPVGNWVGSPVVCAGDKS